MLDATIPEEEPLEFNSSPAPTVGIEMELWLVDARTRELVSAAPDILEHFPKADWLKKELWQCMLELNTKVCKSVKEARQDLEKKLKRITKVTDELGIKLISSGTHPFSDWRDQEISPDARYARLLDVHQWPAARLLISGLHVHIGVQSGEQAIAVVNSINSFVPHLLALSASSPFWHNRDTGLASSRCKIFEGLPKAGLPHFLLNWNEFVRLMHTLVNSGTIQSIRDIWWDFRPHVGFGTVETRICDALPTLSGNLAVAALVQALVVHLSTLYTQGQPMPILKNWTLVENKWRAIRHGLDAEIIRNERGDVIPVREHLAEMFEILRPTAERLGSAAEFAYLDKILEMGNSCERQHRVHERTHELKGVVDSLIWEFDNDEMVAEGDERRFCR